MPKWMQNAIWTIIFLGVIAALIFVGLTVISFQRDGSSKNLSVEPTIDATKIAQWTPTPGPSNSQMSTAVALVPYTKWTPAKSEMFIGALRDKYIVTEQDINIASQLSAPGEGHICVDLKTIFDIKVDDYCKISLTWTEWPLAYKPQEIVVKVEDGKVETDTSKMPLSADGSHYIQRPYAKVTMTIKSIGLVGPVTRFDQSFNFYKDVQTIWKIAIDLKEFIFGVDIREKVNLMTADTTNLALADSFAPLNSDGTRSSDLANQLYDKFVSNVSTPGGGIYNRFLEYATLVANDHSVKCTSKDPKVVCDAGYAGLESLTVIVPAKPNTVCDYVYAEDMTSPVLPRKYCTYTYQQTSITEAAKKALSESIKKSDSNVNYEELLKRLNSIR